MKKLIAIIIVVFAAIACQSGPDYIVTEDGVKYRLINDELGESLQEEDFMVVSISQYVNDSLFFTTPSSIGDVLDPNEPSVSPQLKSILEACSTGDSLEIVMTAEQYSDLVSGFYPPGVDSLDMLTWRIKVSDVGPRDEVIERFQSKLEEISLEQLSLDKEILKEYAVNNNLEYQETEEGILYVVFQQGNGEFPQLGQEVFVNYTVKKMDGTLVDTSYEEVAKANNAYSEQRPGGYVPISFQLGGQGIIPGWNIGIPLFSKGGKGMLLIPSKFAYGTRGRGSIAPNTNLIFDIEVVDFK